MFHELDVVELKKPLPDSAPWINPNSTVPVGSQGTIVSVHSVEDQAYAVEFFNGNNETIDVFDVVGDEYLELKWAY